MSGHREPCPRCELLAAVRAGKPTPEGEPPEHAEDCAKRPRPELVAQRAAQRALRKLGVPEHVPPPPEPTGCELCDGRWELTEFPLMLLHELCDDHRDAVLRNAAETSLRRVLPERHQPARDVPPQLKDWQPLGGKGVLLYGPPGTGKSWTLAALMKRTWMLYYRTMGRPPSVAWWGVADLLDELRSGQKDGKATELLRRLIEVDFLALDDLGAERATEWGLERLYRLLNGRNERMRSTGVTANYDAGQLVARLTPSDDPASARGEQIVSRLVQDTTQVSYEGKPDRRVP